MQRKPDVARLQVVVDDIEKLCADGDSAAVVDDALAADLQNADVVGVDRCDQWADRLLNHSAGDKLLPSVDLWWALV